MAGDGLPTFCVVLDDGGNGSWVVARQKLGALVVFDLLYVAVNTVKYLAFPWLGGLSWLDVATCAVVCFSLFFLLPKDYFRTREGTD